jgi:hypothetical protein
MAKIALLFDKAQLLLANNGFEFRCIRWWLRAKRDKIHVVAVFAGTTSHLTNFYGKDYPPTLYSRDSKTDYVNYNRNSANEPSTLKVYPPFFRICTMGCYHNDIPSMSAEIPSTGTEVLPAYNEWSDFQKSALYGRPLFAHLQKTNQITQDETMNGTIFKNTKLFNILKRMF